MGLKKHFKNMLRKFKKASSIFAMIYIGITFFLIFLLALLIPLMGFLGFSVENFKQETIDHIYFFITTTFTLAGLTSLGGLVGKLKEDKDIKIGLISVSILFLISGLLFIFTISWIYCPKHFDFFGLIPHEGFGVLMMTLGLFYFILGCFIFPAILIVYLWRLLDRENFFKKIEAEIRNLFSF